MIASDDFEGYAGLAQAMTDHPDISIQRRFMWLGIQSLLIQQAELVELEFQIKNLIRKNATSEDPERRKFGISVSALKGPHASFESAQEWEKWLEIREKLRAYWRDLLRLRQLGNISPAHKRDLGVLRTWCELQDGGQNFLQGREKSTWSEEFEKDLMSLATRYQNQDSVSMYIECTLIPWFQKTFRQKRCNPSSLAEFGLARPSPLYDVNESSIRYALNAATTILSCILPTVPIFALLFIQNPLCQMGLIAAFTCLFSAVLLIISNASRVECFIAATGFAAVQVVFVGTTNWTQRS